MLSRRFGTDQIRYSGASEAQKSRVIICIKSRDIGGVEETDCGAEIRELLRAVALAKPWVG